MTAVRECGSSAGMWQQCWNVVAVRDVTAVRNVTAVRDVMAVRNVTAVRDVTAVRNVTAVRECDSNVRA